MSLKGTGTPDMMAGIVSSEEEGLVEGNNPNKTSTQRSGRKGGQIDQMDTSIGMELEAQAMFSFSNSEGQSALQFQQRSLSENFP